MLLTSTLLAAPALSQGMCASPVDYCADDVRPTCACSSILSATAPPHTDLGPTDECPGQFAAYQSCLQRAAAECGSAGDHASQPAATSFPTKQDYRSAQILMCRLGYYGEAIVGYWNSEARAAMAAFQRDAGLRSTRGALASDGLAALEKAVSAATVDIDDAQGTWRGASNHWKVELTIAGETFQANINGPVRFRIYGVVEEGPFLRSTKTSKAYLNQSEIFGPLYRLNYFFHTNRVTIGDGSFAEEGVIELTREE
ncbi:MAG: peptidoglycan-binding protein [Rhodobacteraceae bacterium]|nr:peptidoglycan-binding protein [Paracoccaceae bacterium]